MARQVGTSFTTSDNAGAFQWVQCLTPNDWTTHVQVAGGAPSSQRGRGAHTYYVAGVRSHSSLLHSLFPFLIPPVSIPQTLISITIRVAKIMRFSTSALVLGAASSAVGFQGQKVLGGESGKPIIDMDTKSWMKPFEEVFGEITSEAKAVWDEVSMLMPDAVEAFKQNALPPKPKKVSRKPDSHWDHVVKGADVQALWTEKDGERHREVGGKLENFNLRSKKVDPSKLGVDKVKQYSGYLDDEEEDKHLFYCKSIRSRITSRN